MPTKGGTTAPPTRRAAPPNRKEEKAPPPKAAPTKRRKGREKQHHQKKEPTLFFTMLCLIDYALLYFYLLFNFEHVDFISCKNKKRARHHPKTIGGCGLSGAFVGPRLFKALPLVWRLAWGYGGLFWALSRLGVPLSAIFFSKTFCGFTDFNVMFLDFQFDPISWPLVFFNVIQYE